MLSIHSPDRPTIGPDRPALLLDGSAVPRLTLWPLASGEIEVSTWLRAYDRNASNYTYAWHAAQRAPAALAQLMLDYAADPEATLLALFAWSPQAHKRGASATRSAADAASAAPSFAVPNMAALL